MITARSAKQTTIEAKREKLRLTLDKLEDKIKKAALDGQSSLLTHLFKSEFDLSKPVLEVSGYTLEVDKLYPNLYQVTIRW